MPVFGQDFPDNKASDKYPDVNLCMINIVG
jgi:hypothetical protein